MNGTRLLVDASYRAQKMKLRLTVDTEPHVEECEEARWGTWCGETQSAPQYHAVVRLQYPRKLARKYPRK